LLLLPELLVFVKDATVEVSKECNCCRCTAQSLTCTRWSRSKHARSLSAGTLVPIAGADDDPALALANPPEEGPNSAAAEEENNDDASKGELARAPPPPPALGGSLSFGIPTTVVDESNVRPGLFIAGVRGVTCALWIGVRPVEAVEGRELLELLLAATEVEEEEAVGVFGRVDEAGVLGRAVVEDDVGVFGRGVIGVTAAVAAAAERLELLPLLRCNEAERLRTTSLVVEDRGVTGVLTGAAAPDDDGGGGLVDERRFLLAAREEGRVVAREEAAVLFNERRAATADAADAAAVPLDVPAVEGRLAPMLLLQLLMLPSVPAIGGRRLTSGERVCLAAAAAAAAAAEEEAGGNEARLVRIRAVAAATAEAGGTAFFLAPTTEGASFLAAVAVVVVEEEDEEVDDEWECEVDAVERGVAVAVVSAAAAEDSGCTAMVSPAALCTDKARKCAADVDASVADAIMLAPGDARDAGVAALL
jgi:hypothetical protein